MQATLEISGKTRVFGCISDPISHVRAPSVFNPLFEKHGIDAVMVPLHVPQGVVRVYNGIAGNAEFWRHVDNFAP